MKTLLATTPAVPDNDVITPGVVGFLVTFLVATATVVLVVDMVRRIRRVRYTEEIRARLKNEADVTGYPHLGGVKGRMHDDEQNCRPVAKKRDDRE